MRPAPALRHVCRLQLGAVLNIGATPSPSCLLTSMVSTLSWGTSLLNGFYLKTGQRRRLVDQEPERQGSASVQAWSQAVEPVIGHLKGRLRNWLKVDPEGDVLHPVLKPYKPADAGGGLRLGLKGPLRLCVLTGMLGGWSAERVGTAAVGKAATRQVEYPGPATPPFQWPPSPLSAVGDNCRRISSPEIPFL